MAGHSQFKNIMHRKEAQDKKKAKLFTKLIREITVAARSGGPDPSINPRLRSAIVHARHANLPKETLDRAIKKATEEGEFYEELYYEGFAQGQVAFILEVMTDNKNRTASEIRSLFHKHGGNLGHASFLFSHQGMISYGSLPKLTELMEVAIDHGAQEVQEKKEGGCLILCAQDHFFSLKEKLEQEFGPPEQAYRAWFPHDFHTIEDPETRQNLEKFITALEDHHDVHAVWTNVEFIPSEK